MSVCLSHLVNSNAYALIIFQASPKIRFNKDGTLLAVSTSDNGIKILANADGIRLLRTVENRAFESSRAAATEGMAKVRLLMCYLI